MLFLYTVGKGRWEELKRIKGQEAQRAAAAVVTSESTANTVLFIPSLAYSACSENGKQSKHMLLCPKSYKK